MSRRVNTDKAATGGNVDTSVFVAPNAMSAETAANKAKAAADAAEIAKAEADRIAAEAENGADVNTPPAPFKAQVNVRGQIKSIDVRNRTYREHFNDMARRFLGYMGTDGIKVAGEVESGDVATARYAKDMLALMAVATGIDNGAIPGDVIAVNAEDLK